MHPIALIRAQEQLDKARSAAEAMKNAADTKAVRDCWAEFLFAVSRIYSKLQAGAKGNGWSTDWVRHKMEQRRRDSLLSYLHHARDAEEHGIEDSTGLTNSHVSMPPGSWAVFIVTGPGEWTVAHQRGDVVFPLDRVRLIQVLDRRYGTMFDPPETHLDVPLKNRSPETVADLALAYLSTLVEEARLL